MTDEEIIELWKSITPNAEVRYPWAVTEFARRIIATEREACVAEVEPVAWRTHHDVPMLFPTRIEAAAYCDDDEQPVPLYEG